MNEIFKYIIGAIIGITLTIGFEYQRSPHIRKVFKLFWKKFSSLYKNENGDCKK